MSLGSSDSTAPLNSLQSYLVSPVVELNNHMSDNKNKSISKWPQFLSPCRFKGEKCAHIGCRVDNMENMHGSQTAPDGVGQRAFGSVGSIPGQRSGELIDVAGFHRNYRCRLCAKCFKDKWSVQRHLDGVHSMAKFICQNCNKAYTQLSNLQRHQKYNCRSQLSTV